MAFKILRACWKVSTGSRVHWHHCKEPTSPCICRVLHCGHLSYLYICMSLSISELTVTLWCLGIIHFMDLGWGRRPPPLWREKGLYPPSSPLLKLEPRHTLWAPPITVAAYIRIKEEQFITAQQKDTKIRRHQYHCWTTSVNTLDCWTGCVRAQSCLTLEIWSLLVYIFSWKNNFKYLVISLFNVGWIVTTPTALILPNSSQNMLQFSPLAPVNMTY